MMALKLFVLVLAGIILSTESARILILYPTPALSHQRGQQAITQKLAGLGHEIVLVSPLPPLRPHPNIHRLNVTRLLETRHTMQRLAASDINQIELYYGWKNLTSTMIQLIMESEGIQVLLKNETEHFDAVIVEFLGFTTLHAFAVHFDAPLIGISSVETMVDAYRERGNPTHPILHPGVLVPLPERPNFFKRIQLFYIYVASLVVQYWGLNPQCDELTKKYFNISSVDLLTRVDFQIEEISPVLMNLRPLLPNTVQIGFIHIAPPKPLPYDLQVYMDSADRGVIFVSFGSTLSGDTIGPSFIRILQDTFATLDFDVIWKWESDTMEGKPVNVKLMKWVPQVDLLAHKNLRLFITQGGLKSMEEFIARGVPAIAIPYFADQGFNADRIEQLGVGKCLLKEDVTKELLTETIMEVMTNPKYKKRTQELYGYAMDIPSPPVDTAVWWIEYVMRNRGAPHLRALGVDMPLYQWFLVDILFVHVAVIVVIVTFGLILKRILMESRNKLD